MPPIIPVQVTGPGRTRAPLTADDHAEIAAYRDSFVEELAAIDYEPEFSLAVLSPGDEIFAVTFEPVEMFDQTPGPRAGTQLGVGS